ncbi:unnamed protein product [Cylindrotheca closterium]|uniref:Uncharacterized protein n=1 Tax=Cylindrotheca closterium TaxID=2856 RepID=A0AAD2G3W2_9STRA|nr:unnamed protein product [Cylindrotheca closterium]
MRATSILIGLFPFSSALVVPQASCRQNPGLSMGLYDDPLPPKQSDDDEVAEIPLSARRLFNFKLDGTESRGLLPPLSRSLDSGIGCSFTPSGPEVQDLVETTDCNALDAAWALDACKGDAVQAENCIEAARSKFMNDEPSTSSSSSSSQGFDLRKAERLKKQAAKKGRIIIGPPETGEQDWLPIKNPAPVDDEPWFTG